jgi:hypothetical protein
MATSIRNIKECAVGLHLGDGLCFTNKYVSENSSLITLDDSETSGTIRYRLNLKNIQTICLHHVAAFSTHFHRQDQSIKCKDPFGKHQPSLGKRKRKCIGNKMATLTKADQMALKSKAVPIFPGQGFSRAEIIIGLL